MYAALEDMGVGTGDDLYRDAFDPACSTVGTMPGQAAVQRGPEGKLPRSTAAGAHGKDVMALPAGGWQTGPVRPAGRTANVSDRPLLCMSVFGDVAVVGSADHGLIEVELKGSGRDPTAALRPRRTLYTKAYGHAEWVADVAHLPDGRVLSAGMDSKACDPLLYSPYALTLTLPLTPVPLSPSTPSCATLSPKPSPEPFTLTLPLRLPPPSKGTAIRAIIQSALSAYHRSLTPHPHPPPSPPNLPWWCHVPRGRCACGRPTAHQNASTSLVIPARSPASLARPTAPSHSPRATTRRCAPPPPDLPHLPWPLPWPLSASYDKTVRLCSTATGNAPHRLTLPHPTSRGDTWRHETGALVVDGERQGAGQVACSPRANHACRMGRHASPLPP